MNSFGLCKHQGLVQNGELLYCLGCTGVFNLEGDVHSKYPGCECSICPFKDAPFVPPDGPQNAQLLFVGMVPARNEVRLGKPFVGPAGNLFDATLGTQNISRESVAVDNATLCCGIMPRQGDPPIGAIQACKGHITASMENHKIIIPMGNAALRSTINWNKTSGIMEVAGSTFRYGNNIIMPWIHPSFYLSNSSDTFKDLLDNVKLLRKIIDGQPLYSDTEVKVKVFTDAEECINWLDNLEDKDILAVDLETDFPDPVRGLITCVSLAWNVEEAYIIPWSQEYLESHNSSIEGLLERQDVYDALKRCLERQSNVTMHNAPFDARLLWREEINLKVKHDSLLMHYALDERATSQGLKKVAKMTLGVGDWELDIKQYLKRKSDPYTEIPPKYLFYYAGKDACYTVGITLEFLKELSLPENKGPRKLYQDTLTKINQMFMEISMEGVTMDKHALASAMLTMPKKLDDLEHELSEMSGSWLFNPRSPQQVSEVLFKKFKMQQIKGNSTDKTVLETLKGGEVEDEDDFNALNTGQQFIHRLIEYRQYQKVVGTYMINFAKGYLKGKGYPDLRLFGTVTGRLSGGKFNPLVFPRESRGELYRSVKDIIIAEDGYCIWVVDCKGMELRILAYLADDPWLIEQMNDRDIDFHSIMAQEIFGDRFKNADVGSRKELRVIAKMLVFGLNYGRGAPSIAKQLKCSITEAKSLVDRYFAPMPRVKAWREEIYLEALDLEYLETRVGRRRRFHMITDDNLHDIEKQAMNTPVQSLANDVNLEVMWNLRERVYPDIMPHFPVHDSVVLSANLDMSADRIQEVLQIFATIPQEYLETDKQEFHWDVAVGDSWGRAKEITTVEGIMAKHQELKESQATRN